MWIRKKTHSEKFGRSRRSMLKPFIGIYVLNMWIREPPKLYIWPDTYTYKIRLKWAILKFVISPFETNLLVFLIMFWTFEAYQDLS